MAKEDESKSGLTGWIRRYLPAFLVGALLGAFLAWLVVRPPPAENTCDWPNVSCEAPGNPTARILLDGILAATEEALQKGYIDEGRRNEIAYLVERAKDPDLRNRLGWHVCVVANPRACEELVSVARDAQDAQQAGGGGNEKPLWDKVIEGLREFPSGS